VPPLRERRESIAAFVAHFIEHYNRLFGKSVKYLSRAALELLVAYSWPGNVRELAHAIESAIILTDSDRISPDDLPEHVVANAEEGALEVSHVLGDELIAGDANGTGVQDSQPYSLDSVIKQASKLALVRALRATDGNCHRAAELLGVSRYTVYRMLSRYGLSHARAWRKTRPQTA
ncbi:MAG: helix-turn-helix domain-containing protein, partial [Candidatus Binataceae bacterium]